MAADPYPHSEAGKVSTQRRHMSASRCRSDVRSIETVAVLLSTPEPLQPLDEVAGVHLHRCCEPGDQVEARVPPAALQRSDVRPVDVRLQRELFLRPAQLVTAGTDTVTELDLPSSAPLVRTAHGARVQRAVAFGSLESG